MIQDSEITRTDPEKLVIEYRGLVHKIANSYRKIMNYVQAVDYDDIIQAGYIGLIFAQRKYDVSSGSSFMNYACFFIRSQIRRTLGIDGRRDLPEIPLSLDAPISSDHEELTLCDTIPADIDIAGDYADADEREQIRKEVHAAIDRLQVEQQREIIKKHYLQGEPFAEVAAELGCDINKVSSAKQTALSKLRRDMALKRLCAPSFRVGVQSFRTTLTSEVEKTVLWKENKIDNIFGPGAYIESGKPEPKEEI